MFRKLVKLDPKNGGRFCEVDHIRLKREVLALKDYLENRMEDDAYNARKRSLKLCEDLLNNRIRLPINGDHIGGWGYPCSERWLPESFCTRFRRVESAATGSPLDLPEIQGIDGEEYAYMDFEEPGDWPEVVEQYAKERDRRWREKFAWTEDDCRLAEARQRERQAMLDAEEREAEQRLRRKRMQQQ